MLISKSEVKKYVNLIFYFLFIDKLIVRLNFIQITSLCSYSSDLKYMLSVSFLIATPIKVWSKFIHDILIIPYHCDCVIAYS